MRFYRANANRIASYLFCSVLLVASGSGCAPAADQAADKTTEQLPQPSMSSADRATAAPSFKAPPPAAPAVDQANKIKKASTEVARIVKITSNNDPNDLLGKETGYSDAAVIVDRRTIAGKFDWDCVTRVGIRCGVTIEVFPTVVKAMERKSFLDTQITNEWSAVQGYSLIRINKEIGEEGCREYLKLFLS